MSKKTKGLLFNTVLYAFAFAIGLFLFTKIDDIFLAEAILTASATLVIYIVTCFIPDTSLYDPYWSVAPVIMVLAAMLKYDLWSANGVIIFGVILIWSVRLSINWLTTYKGLLNEDWRYKKYRDKYNAFGFAIINFVGLQYVPTIVVYAGLIPAFFILQNKGFSWWIIPGVIITLTGIALEFFSDRAIHKFLKNNRGQNKTCNISLWKYSRHPNYLGEMTFWTGIFVSFVALNPSIWYFGLGFISIIMLFLFVSIPMMEKHNLERRVDYVEYQNKTSMLLLLPNKDK